MTEVKKTEVVRTDVVRNEVVRPEVTRTEVVRPGVVVKEEFKTSEIKVEGKRRYTGYVPKRGDYVKVESLPLGSKHFVIGRVHSVTFTKLDELGYVTDYSEPTFIDFVSVTDNMEIKTEKVPLSRAVFIMAGDTILTAPVEPVPVLINPVTGAIVSPRNPLTGIPVPVKVEDLTSLEAERKAAESKSPVVPVTTPIIKTEVVKTTEIK